jgi:hypothetical protein
MDNREEFMSGYHEMIKRISPATVINYGQSIDGMNELAEVINVIPKNPTEYWKVQREKYEE